MKILLKVPILVILTLLSNMIYCQSKINNSYSYDFDKENYDEICSITSSIFPSFDNEKLSNNKFAWKNDRDDLTISISKKGNIKVVLKTTDEGSENIKKVKELSSKLKNLIK